MDFYSHNHIVVVTLIQYLCLILGVLKKADHEVIGKLIIQIRSGDENAWVKLVDMIKEPTYNYCYYHLWDKNHAEDAAEEALVRSFEKINELRNPEAYFMYVLRIAKNVCVDMIRDRSKTNPLPDEFDLPDIKSDSSLNIRIEKSRYHQKIVHDALDNLGGMAKQVVLLKVVEGLKHKEIATALDISEANSKIIYMRSIDKLSSMNHLRELFQFISGGY
jgi:RNA polymerase sigma-70 factor, ECF subfamily